MSNPVAELDRCKVSGHPVLSLYNLRPAQVKLVEGVMLYNKPTDLHEARSLAMAHLGVWCSKSGRADIYMHSDEQGHRDAFLTMLRDRLNISIPRVPACDYQRVG